jgi:hypothetical protein
MDQSGARPSRATAARPEGRSDARRSAAPVPAAFRACAAPSAGEATALPPRRGSAAAGSASESASSLPPSGLTAWLSEAETSAQSSAWRTSPNGRPVASASSSRLGSRPSAGASVRAAQASLCWRSPTCVGMRIVLAWLPPWPSTPAATGCACQLFAGRDRSSATALRRADRRGPRSSTPTVFSR